MSHNYCITYFFVLQCFLQKEVESVRMKETAYSTLRYYARALRHISQIPSEIYIATCFCSCRRAPSFCRQKDGKDRQGKTYRQFSPEPLSQRPKGQRPFGILQNSYFTAFIILHRREGAHICKGGVSPPVIQQPRSARRNNDYNNNYT